MTSRIVLRRILVLLVLLVGLIFVALASPRATEAAEAPLHPNIVWIVLDDAGPDFGCHGDPIARTPRIDALAAEGTRFPNAFTSTPVCAPARSCLVTGRYPTSLGTLHMRSVLRDPPATFMELLRAAGYRVAWPGKTDFNFAPPEAAFDSKADWTAPGAMPEEPFFAYMNVGTTHEGQVRMSDAKFEEVLSRHPPEVAAAARRAPEEMRVPPYYPDLPEAPEIRRDLARYYGLLTLADHRVGEILDAIDRAGVADRTVVMLFSDHGRGMPRAKRWLYDSGVRVPLIVRSPGGPAGAIDERLASFVDFAPTVLSLAGASIPSEMQGVPFLGGAAAAPREFAFLHRDRMDETHDRIRAVTDGRWKYVRNHHPELPYAQRIAYNEENPTMAAWRRMDAEGRLAGSSALFFRPAKPAEELYDTRSDPYEVNDLAGVPEFAERLERMRRALDDWTAAYGDLGAVSESELVARGLVEDVSEKYEERRSRPREADGNLVDAPDRRRRLRDVTPRP